MAHRHVGFGVLLFALGASLVPRVSAQNAQALTPIKHLVILFEENRPFDHYFGTYPVAANLPGETPFKAHPDTPTVDGFTADLLYSNPNASNPIRLGPNQAIQCSQTHDYTKEQKAADLGQMDLFVEWNHATGTQGFSSCPPEIVMSYFDGNTVTALWNYAQRFAMSDRHFATNWGSSAVGAINLVSGQTHGASIPTSGSDTIEGSVIGNPRPLLDECSPLNTTLITLSGKNIGNLLNDAGVTWGWFNGGFRTAAGAAGCALAHTGSNGQAQADYIPHHQPFQYYPSTANPHHLPPTGVIGETDQANHQYDLELDFWPAAESGQLPAVSFIKAPAYLDGHNRYSDPLAEQRFLVDTINRLQRLPEWKDMAILIVYDDSDGLYDHVLPPLANPSNTAADALTAPGACGTSAPGAYQGRCGYGPRLPFLVISPYARNNFVDHTVTDQSSVIRFIEDNWGLPRIGDQSFDELAGSIMGMFDFSKNGHSRHLFLDPVTGQRIEDDE
jgi:phospholipase C